MDKLFATAKLLQQQFEHIKEEITKNMPRATSKSEVRDASEANASLPPSTTAAASDVKATSTSAAESGSSAAASAAGGSDAKGGGGALLQYVIISAISSGISPNFYLAAEELHHFFDGDLQAHGKSFLFSRLLFARLLTTRLWVLLLCR